MYMVSYRLGKHMNRRLAEDETALENVNKKNRPTKIADEYMELISNQWLGAMDKLDDVYPGDQKEEFRLKLLCNILVVSDYKVMYPLAVLMVNQDCLFLVYTCIEFRLM